MPMIALAPCCAACCSSNSYASSRAFSQSSVNTVMFPPMIVWMLAARFPNTLRDRTVIPRTIPKFRSTRYPFSSFPEVTIELSTRPFIVLYLLFPLFVHLFTAAILPLYYLTRHLHRSVILELTWKPYLIFWRFYRSLQDSICSGRASSGLSTCTGG